MHLHRSHLRFAAIALAAAAAPLATGCRNDGVVIASAGGPGRGGAGGAAGNSAGPGGGAAGAGGGAGAGARGGAGAAVGGSAGSSGASDGGVTNDGGMTLAWVDLSPCHFPATIPVGRTEPLVTFDSDRGKLVAYGGAGGYSDLWEVDLATGLRTDRTTCASVDILGYAGDAFVYDAARKRVVVFPYSGASDVREWDPVADVWTDRPAPSGAVPAGEGRVAVFDTARARVIVFITHIDQPSGGGGLSVWEWDGATGTWTLRQSSFPIDFFTMPSLAFDAGRGVLWGFGGEPETANVEDDRLWTWNVTTTGFVDLTPATRPAAWPAARAGAGLAYDGARGKLDLFGGFAGSFSRRDFWEWDAASATWTDLTPSNVAPTGVSALPPGIVWPDVDYIGEDQLYADPARGRLVYLHGDDLMATGHSGAWLWDTARKTWSEPKVDTPPALWPSYVGSASTTWDDDDGALFLASYGRLWRWTSTNGVWTAIAWPGGMGAPNSLPIIDGMAIAYDPKARKVVLFGGYVALDGGTPAALTAELRLWDPATARLSMVSRPAGAAWPDPRRDHALAYDPVRQRVLLFGGGKPEASRELWELDTASATWRDLSGASAGAAWPEARMGHSLALDPERSVLVLKGGGDTSSNPVAALDATWELGAGTTGWSRRADPSPSGPVAAPLAFVPGVGLLTVGVAAGAAGGLELVRWDATGGAWMSLGVGLPSPTLPAPGALGGLVGTSDHLLMLWAPVLDTSVPAEDRYFFQLWRWGVTP